MTISYIAKNSDYWLRVKLQGGPVVSVPYGLKIDRTGQAIDRVSKKPDGREHFKILEGVNKGKLASISTTGPAAEKYFDATISHSRSVSLTFDRAAQTLMLSGYGPINAFSGGGHMGFTQIAAGSYDLAIPAYPSAQTRVAYNRWCKHHNLWFRIGIQTTGSRFLHTGSISEGCVTVRQFLYDPALGPPPGGQDFADLVGLASTAPGLIGLPLPKTRAPCVGWDTIVDTLIMARLNDQAVGTLVVT
jgi:hypothetical protein